jgi:sugar phosphate isomerase/epimerase
VRFAIAGDLLPGHIDEFSDDHARLVRELGFTGCFVNFGQDDPFATSQASIRRTRSILDDHGLEVVQAIGHHPPLAHPDEAFRQRGIALLQQALRIAGGLRAHSCHTGPGSAAQVVDPRSTNPSRGAWSPHPRNRDPACLERLVASLKECAPVAEDHGTRIGLEGHVLVSVDTPEVMRDVLDAVGSPAVRCDLDPVNWLRLETVFDSGAAIDHMIDVLGPDRILHAHAKDVILEERLVTHLDERPAGQGLLDFATFMRRMEALGPERYLVIEHTSLADIPAARAFLAQTADEQGIRVY